MSRLMPLLVLLASSLPLAASAQNVFDDPWALAAEAVADHPGIQALEHRRKALTEAASASRVWNDPVLGVDLSNLPVTSPILTGHPMAGVQLMLSQRLLAPGKGRARANEADARVDAAAEAEAAAIHALRGEVVRGYWDLARLRALTEISRDHAALAADLKDAARVRYEVGGGDAHVVLQLELREARLQEAAIDLAARADAVGDALGGAFATPRAVTAGLAPLAAPTDALDGALASLGDHVPAARAASARSTVAAAEADRARAETLPDPTVTLGYRIRAAQANGDPGTNFVTAGIRLPLPAASTRSWNARAAAAKERAASADAQARAAVQRAAAEAEAARTRHARAVSRIEALDARLLPAAQATFDATRAAYEVGRASFADLLRAEETLLALQIRRVDSLAEGHQALAALYVLVGSAPGEVSR